MVRNGYRDWSFNKCLEGEKYVGDKGLCDEVVGMEEDRRLEFDGI